MRLAKRVNSRGIVDGYTLWLSSSDTYAWARAWPCSTLAGDRLAICVDQNGLYALYVNGRSGDVDGHELDAIVADFLPEQYRPLWPCWAPGPGSA